MLLATVGREAEISSIDSFLDEASPGLSTLLIEGDGGIGKTTLWEEAAEAARSHSCRETSLDGVRAISGDAKYERLVALKRSWDSDNVFHPNQNIKP